MTKLDELIDNYGQVNAQLKEIKKEADQLNTELKQRLRDEGITSYTTQNYKIQYVTRKSESLNEDKVIQILKDNDIDGIVKTKEYVDENALETAIYNGALSQEVLHKISECRITKETVALTVKERYL